MTNYDAKSRSINQSSTTFKQTRLALSLALLASSCNICIGSLPLLPLLFPCLLIPFTSMSLSSLGLHSSFHHLWSHATTFTWSSYIKWMTLMEYGDRVGVLWTQWPISCMTVEWHSMATDDEGEMSSSVRRSHRLNAAQRQREKKATPSAFACS